MAKKVGPGFIRRLYKLGQNGKHDCNSPSNLKKNHEDFMDVCFI